MLLWFFGLLGNVLRLAALAAGRPNCSVSQLARKNGSLRPPRATSETPPRPARRRLLRSGDLMAVNRYDNITTIRRHVCTRVSGARLDLSRGGGVHPLQARVMPRPFETDTWGAFSSSTCAPPPFFRHSCPCLHVLRVLQILSLGHTIQRSRGHTRAPIAQWRTVSLVN